MKPIQRGLEDLEQLFHDLSVSPFYLAIAAGSFGRQTDQRTATFPIIKVIEREVGIDDSPGLCLVSFGRVDLRGLPWIWRFLADETPDGLGIEVALTAERP